METARNLYEFYGMNAAKYKRNELNFWKVHGIMNTLGLLQSKLTAGDPNFHASMNRPKIEFIAHIYTYYKHLKYKKNIYSLGNKTVL